MCLLEELYKVKDVKDILKCCVKLHVNIAAQFCQFHEKLKETTKPSRGIGEGDVTLSK